MSRSRNGRIAVRAAYADGILVAAHAPSSSYQDRTAPKNDSPSAPVLLVGRVHKGSQSGAQSYQISAGFKIEADYLRQIEVEKKRVDDLLHATLPAAAVHELKTTNTVKPRRFDDVAVLFCDVVEFTTYCDRRPPEEVVAHLQALVTGYEEIVERHGLEKIKTIGDAFMATAGLLQYVKEPAVASARAAFDMLEATRGHDAGWQVRIGIHMGPLVGGVIGRQKYSFDVWGDTVNIAQRIAAQSDPGTVLVSASVWRNLGEMFRGRSKGLVELKGKGSLELIECSVPP